MKNPESKPNNAPTQDFTLLKDRESQVATAGTAAPVRCARPSTAGSVSQRACVFCGSRVVLYPIADALHLVHGPVGCAAYTWDIRGSLSSGPELHRMSFSTDLREHDVIHGGAKRLEKGLRELIAEHKPEAAFVYSTCIAGLIGDDVDAVCRKVEADVDIPVISVQSEGFKGSKKDGYRAACDAIAKLIGREQGPAPISPFSINILGDFNIAGEIWGIRKIYERMGVEVVATITGDGRVKDIGRSHLARLNVVQCSGSMTGLAKDMERLYGIPYIRVSYFGIEDMSEALYDVARHFEDEALLRRTREVVHEEVTALMSELGTLRKDLQGHKAAIYVGGSFKAISLVRALRHVGVRTVLVGSQTGGPEDYAMLQNLCDPGTVIVDDSNPRELAHYVQETGADFFIGGVKERPLAYKLGLGFCDHNHERKTPLAGFEGMLNFAREVRASVHSPVWKFVNRGGRA